MFRKLNLLILRGDESGAEQLAVEIVREAFRATRTLRWTMASDISVMGMAEISEKQLRAVGCKTIGDIAAKIRRGFRFSKHCTPYVLEDMREAIERNRIRERMKFQKIATTSP